jgi:ribosomal protein S27E
MYSVKPFEKAIKKLRADFLAQGITLLDQSSLVVQCNICGEHWYLLKDNIIDIECPNGCRIDYSNLSDYEKYLKKHGVTLIDYSNSIFECDICGKRWTICAGRRRGLWKCPNECNC